MKHLFSFRQRPNETLTHSTTRGLNGSRMVVETTVKGRSNDCRPTVGRLSTLFLLLFALSFGFNQEVKAGVGFYQGNIVFDATGWTSTKNMSFYVGRETGKWWTAIYPLSTKISNTNLYYAWCSNGGSWWDNPTYFAVAATSSTWSSGEWGYSNISDHADYYTGKFTGPSSTKYDINSSNLYFIQPSSTSKGASITITYYDNPSKLNQAVKVGSKIKTASSNSYSDQVASVAKVYAKYYEFSSANYTPTDKYSSNYLTINKGTKGTSTIYSAITSNVNFSYSNLTTGYQFDGWYDGDGNQIKSDASFTEATKAGKTIYAYFSAISYSITYKDQGDETFSGTGWGSEGTHPDSYDVATSTITLAQPTKPGYVFEGWFENSSCTGAAVPTITKGSTGNKTFYAKWRIQTYSVTFGVHSSEHGSIEATVDENAISSGEQVGASSEVVFTANPNIGYSVEGWYSDVACSQPIAGAGTGTSYTIASLAKDETVYVKFKYTDYTINFVVDPAVGGTITKPTTKPKTDAHFQEQFDIEVEENEGYTFVNWTSTDDITLGVADPSSAMTPSRKLTNDGGVELHESASQKGTNAALTNVNGDKTITAHFTETMHTVSVVANDDNKGTVSPASVSGVGVTTKSEEITASPKPGYYFTGWDIPQGVTLAQGYTLQSPTIKINATADSKTITANFAPRFYLRGSIQGKPDSETGGMPGWDDAAKTNGLFSSISSNTATITMPLNASTTYKLKLGDMTGNSWGGSHDFKSGDDFWTFACHTENDCAAPTFTTAIADTYTFTIDFSEASPKMKITYPTPDFTLQVAETRVYKESTLPFIAGDGTEANPYQFYLDEKMHLAITALPAVAGVTAWYEFGSDVSTVTRTKDITVNNTSLQSIEVKTYYKAIQGSYVSEKKTETIWYQGVATPALHLTASWNEKEVSELSENPEVTIYYSTDNYAGAAIVTSSVDGAAPTNFMTITTEMQKDKTYQMGNKQPHRYDFEATATINNRTLIATTSVSIYRLVEVRVKDTGHLMSKYYMWINGSDPIQQEAAWPGNDFIGKLGDWHIFLVKYPSYTHFVLNDGQSTGAEQTVDVQLPDHNACYEIGAKGQDNKYAVTEADCPPILYVGNIANVTLHQGESQLITPDVDLDFGYNESQLQITFPNLPSNFTAVPQGKNFMLTGADQCPATLITVKYTLSDDVNSHEETRTFYATVTHPSNIMIQVKYNPNDLGWGKGDHNNTWLHYWGANINVYVQMTYKDWVDNKDRYYAKIPLDANGVINFQVGYPEGKNWYSWRQTDDVTNVSQPGCYTITSRGNDQPRVITRDGDDCWAEYQAVVNMANGKTYYSNKVENLNDIVSFYAPGKDETGNKSGLVRILRNGTQVATVPATTFNSSTVYTAKIAEGGTGLTNVEYYTGNYYIRTDGAEGGWDKDKYKQESHKFTYFTPYEGALYDYYWVKNIQKNGELNIKACIGNEYNEDLANMIEASNYTDGYGDITPDAGTGVNLRFGYNPETNYFERSILRGSTVSSNDFLNIVGDNIYNDDDCTKELNKANYSSHPDWSKFGDISNWVYEKNIYVKIDGGHQSAQALLQSKAFDGTIIYQLGYTRNPITGAITSTPAQRDILSIGTTNGTYNIRVIYDFKTNRIVSAWSPIEDVTYGDERRINADVLFVRHEEQPVAQVNLSDNNAKVSSLKSAYFVMEIDGATDKASESIYWFSVPFDCYINSIFGVEGYVTLDNNGNPTAGTWGIQEYDGKTRAEKGWYETQTKTFWRWMRKDEKLEKGHGYVLVFDRADASNKSLWKEISREEPCKDTDTDPSCVDGKKTITTTVLRLYFPSSESGWQMTRSGADQTVTYDDWTCQKKNRKAQDSNWRLLGTDSYSDIMITEEAQFSRSEKDSVLDQAPNFVYEFHPEAEQYRWYVAVSSLNRPFQSFYCYMVQFSGTIKWNQYTQSKPDQQVAARRVVAENELTNAQMTLSLKKGNNTEDNTYIYMDARATTDFDNQMDLTKITDTRANQIYSVIEEVEYAGNTLPVEDQIVPITVNVNANGAYTFAMPNMTDGLEVYLIDNTTGSHTDMAIDSYTVDLNKGKIADRFYLDVRVKERTTPTIIETIGADGNPTGDRFIKVIQNDQLHIIRNGRIYNASGMKLTK